MGKKLHRDVLKAYAEDPLLFKSSLTQVLQKFLIIFFVIMHFKRVDSHRYPELSYFDINKNLSGLIGFIIYQAVIRAVAQHFDSYYLDDRNVNKLVDKIPPQY